MNFVWRHETETRLSVPMHILATSSSLRIHYLKPITAAALRSKLIFVLYSQVMDYPKTDYLQVITED